MIRRVLYSLAQDFNDFAEHTSAHGIPRAYISSGRRRILWLLLFFLCLSLFGQQAFFIVERFRSKPILVSVEIKFERIAFPSVTVCNLNPYKNSFARSVSGLQDTLSAFETAVEKVGGNRKKRDVDWEDEEEWEEIEGKEWDISVYARCHHSNDSICICVSSPSSSLFNCYAQSLWTSVACDCTDTCQPSSNSSLICDCIDEYCIRSGTFDWVSVRRSSLQRESCKGRWCLCSWRGCYEDEEWRRRECGGCDWRGDCVAGLRGEQCLCRGDECYAVEGRKGGMGKGMEGIRVKRETMNIEKTISHYDGLLAVNSFCQCGEVDCVGIKDKSVTNGSTNCFCFYNKKNEQLWPCYERHKWEKRKCTRCSTFGDCIYSTSPNATKDCLCAKDIKIRLMMCVRLDPGEKEEKNTTLESTLVNYWQIVSSTTYSSVQRKKEKTEKALGMTGLRDPIAIMTRAAENIVFAVDQLSEDQKKAISYSKTEFITKCSFNGRECSIEKDFTTHTDPTYGNCFTFNNDVTDNITSERAGPAYGLRFQVFVNVSDYLPTTEAAGVRLTVHSPEEQPFPDTLGYSAPTGFVSSFGIKLKHMTRLPSPYGDCIEEGKDEGYIYADKQYSTEGCQRSCIQRYLVSKCGCGDPRFPALHKTRNCPVDDPDRRECLAHQIQWAARFLADIGCVCPQPCRQLVYSVSYSTARWPSSPSIRPDCPVGLSPLHCLQYLRQQGALIEVFFEQLNYESLVESEAYGLPNLLSDFGGQLGLWMGVSVITISEVAILAFDIVMSILCCGRLSVRKMSSRRSLAGSLRRRKMSSLSRSPHHSPAANKDHSLIVDNNGK